MSPLAWLRNVIYLSKPRVTTLVYVQSNKGELPWLRITRFPFLRSASLCETPKPREAECTVPEVGRRIRIPLRNPW